MDPDWDRVLRVRQMVGSQIAKRLRWWQPYDMDDARHECYVRLHGAAGMFRGPEHRWPAYALAVIDNALTNWLIRGAKSVKPGGLLLRDVAASQKHASPAVRCVSCCRALVSQTDYKRVPIDHELEARTYRLTPPTCSSCAKREARHAAS